MPASNNAISPLVALAAGLMRRAERQAVIDARETIQDRQKHVAQGVALSRLAQAAYSDYLAMENRLRSSIIRPKWLTERTNFWAKLLLILSEITAGTAMLYIAGDPLWLAIPTFTGVATATVLAGTHLGIQARRREEGEPAGLAGLAAGAVFLASVMIGLYRYLTIGPVFATLAFVTLMIALGSVFLGYIWHDRKADEVARANDLHRMLKVEAEAEFTARPVRRFEKAEAKLRPAASEALSEAYGQVLRGPSHMSGATGENRTDAAPVCPPNRAMVDELLVTLVGPEILQLIPKAEAAGRRPPEDRKPNEGNPFRAVEPGDDSDDVEPDTDAA